MLPVWPLIALILAVLFYGAYESRRHRRALHSIPIRIHINGTRGKSSVTRLIAAGLRAGGLRTCAKTTGTSPRFIFPDGHELAIRRRGLPNIIEQVWALQQAYRVRARAIVFECMALQPHLQRTERQVIAPTIGVITNVRADHLDVMGPTVQTVARVLSQAIPLRQLLITSENADIPRAIVLDEAERRGTRVVLTGDNDVSDEVMRGFGYLEHKANVGVALTVCQTLGVARDTALEGMYRAVPDPGVLRSHRFTVFDKQIEFIEALAANDPDSITLIWRRLAKQFQSAQQRIILLNCREDRTYRTAQLVRCIIQKLSAHCVILMGGGQNLAQRLFKRLAQDHLHVIACGRASPSQVYRRVLEQCTQNSIVFAIGNTAGDGLAIADLFAAAGAKHG